MSDVNHWDDVMDLINAGIGATQPMSSAATHPMSSAADEPSADTGAFVSEYRRESRLLREERLVWRVAKPKNDASELESSAPKLYVAKKNFKLSNTQAQKMADTDFGTYVILLSLFTKKRGVPARIPTARIPPIISWKVNDKLVETRSRAPGTRPSPVEVLFGVDKIDLTAQCHLSPNTLYTVSLESPANLKSSRYHVEINFARQIVFLGDHMVEVRPKSETARLIADKFGGDDDDVAAISPLTASVLCPFFRVRMQTPCRADTCVHVQCFDVNVYITECEWKKKMWLCPVCGVEVNPSKLRIDAYFLDVLRSTILPEDATNVEIHEDGSWNPLVPKHSSLKDDFDRKVRSIGRHAETSEVAVDGNSDGKSDDSCEVILD